MKKTLAVALFLLLSVAAWAQMPGGGQPASWVTFVAADPVTVAPGKFGTVTMLFKVNDGFHVNSNKPNSELLIPTTVRFNAPTDITLTKTTYPEGSLIELPFSEEKVSVYTGEFKVTSMVKPLASAKKGTYRVHSELKYQACNDRQCFPPKTIPFAFDVKVAKPKTVKPKSNPQSPHIKS